MDTIKLSQIARNPAVAAFFARGERDNGAAFAVPAPTTPNKPGGAETKMEIA